MLAVHSSPWIIFVLLFILMSVLFLRWDAWASARRIQTTNDAYVYIDNVLIEAKVSGYVKKVGFSDYQEVEAGQILIALVDDDFQLAVKQAEAKRNHAKASLEKLELEEELQKASIEQARAALDSAAANVEHLERENVRIATLFKQNVVSDSEADLSETNVKTARAEQDRQRASLAVERQKLKLLDGDRALRAAELDAAEAALADSKIELSYTVLKSPIRCTAGASKIREGELVKVGTVVATLTPYQAPYVIAYYRETQLANIHIGEAATLRIDAFPDQRLRGRVTGISPATGATYSLLPVDRSTGNFTKVVQRVPVRIDLEPNQPLAASLRGGMSATTSIDTRSPPGPGSTRRKAHATARH